MEYLYELIMRVSDFPEIYLGKPSLERLYAFIGGYLEAKPEADDHCLDGFNEYVSEKYGINSDHNWSGIISFFSTSEKQAFEQFKTLFAEFRNSSGVSLENSSDSHPANPK